MERDVLKAGVVGSSVIPQKVVDQNRVDILGRHFRMVGFQILQNQFLCLLDDVDGSASDLDFGLFSVLQQLSGFQVLHQLVSVAHGFEVDQNLRHSIVSKHRDNFVQVFEGAKSFTSKASINIADQDLSSLVNANSFTMEVGMISEAREVFNDEIQKLQSRSTSSLDNVLEVAVVFLQKLRTNFVQALNSLFHERRLGSRLVRPQQLFESFQRDFRVESRVREVDSVPDSASDRSTKRKISSLPIDGPLLAVVLTPEAEVQRVNEKNPVEGGRVRWLRVKLVLAEVVNAQRLVQNSLDDLQKSKFKVNCLKL